MSTATSCRQQCLPVSPFWTTLLLLLLLLVPPRSRVAEGFPTGAGGCAGGEAAVGGSHLTRPSVRGSALSEAAIEVSIGGRVVAPAAGGGATVALETATDYAVAVTGTRFAYKGCLIRLEAVGGQDTVGALLPDVNTGVADACAAPVVGVTHTNSNFKSLHTGVVRMDDPGDVVLDVTIVGINNATVSLYAYDRFALTFLPPGATLPPTAPPTTRAPTATTVAPTTQAPVVPPTEAPVITPTTNAPTAGPTSQPVLPEPTAGPTLTPTTQRPVVPETEPPAVPPTTAAPAVSPTNAPTTEAPVVATVSPATATPTAAPSSPVATAEPTGTATAEPTGTATAEPTGSRSVVPPSTPAPSPPEAAGDTEEVDLLVENVLVAFENVDEMNSAEESDWKKLTEVWFNEFFNGKGSSSRRRLKGRRQREGRVLVQSRYGVLQGSMNTTITVISQEVDGNSNQIIYNQKLSYTAVVDDPRKVGPLQYTTLPFRSPRANTDYSNRLMQNMTAFASVATPIAVPKIGGGGESGDGGDDDGLSGGAIAGIVIAALVVAGGGGYAAYRYYGEGAKSGSGSTTGAGAPTSKAETAFDHGYTGDSMDSPASSKNVPADGDGAASASSMVPLNGDQQSLATNDFDYAKVATGSVALSANNGGSTAITGVEGEQYVVYAPAGKLGVVLDNPDAKGPIVYAIKEDSPLYDQMEVGDRLIAVDEVDVRSLSPTKVSKLISKRSQNPMRKFALIRGGGGAQQSSMRSVLTGAQEQQADQQQDGEQSEQQQRDEEEQQPEQQVDHKQNEEQSEQQQKDEEEQLEEEPPKEEQKNENEDA